MHVEDYFNAIKNAINGISVTQIDALIQELVSLRERQGRLFLLGVGGSAANCSHATSDFRKLCSIEAYCPTDNVAELTARANDEGWETIFWPWLRISNLNSNDAILIFSVGGGTVNTSKCLWHAIDFAHRVAAKVFGIVGQPGGYTFLRGHLVVQVPSIKPMITPVTEAMQAVIWHCLVTHPLLQANACKW